jgi:hypothetical protein
MVRELLVGDNPFIGISHLAQEKARQHYGNVSLLDKEKVLEAAVESGATGFTFSVHEANFELLTHLSAHRRDLFNGMDYYIVAPYAQSYVRAANLRGTPELIGSTLGKAIGRCSIRDLFAAFTSLKLETLAGLLINMELAAYIDLLPRQRVKAILLHEVLTDLIVAFDLANLLRHLTNYVRARMKLNFGLVTRNFGQLHAWMSSIGYRSDYVMTPINLLGYQMSPNRVSVENALADASHRSKIIATGVLASGTINLTHAVEYLCAHRDELHAVTVASTKPDRLREDLHMLVIRLQDY